MADCAVIVPGTRCRPARVTNAQADTVLGAIIAQIRA